MLSNLHCTIPQPSSPPLGPLTVPQNPRAAALSCVELAEGRRETQGLGTESLNPVSTNAPLFTVSIAFKRDFCLKKKFYV